MPRAAKPSPPKPVVIIDSREQRPFTFSDAVDTVRGTLATGDYSLQNHEAEICVERKALDDYVGTVVNDYFRRADEPPKRFERELERMQSFVVRAIIVEASWADLRDARYVSRVHPSAIFAATCCIQIDHRVPVLMCHDRAIAARVCERMIRRYAENLERAQAEAFEATRAENERAATCLSQSVPTCDR